MFIFPFVFLLNYCLLNVLLTLCYKYFLFCLIYYSSSLMFLITSICLYLFDCLYLSLLLLLTIEIPKSAKFYYWFWRSKIVLKPRDFVENESSWKYLLFYRTCLSYFCPFELEMCCLLLSFCPINSVKLIILLFYLLFYINQSNNSNQI